MVAFKNLKIRTPEERAASHEARNAEWDKLRRKDLKLAQDLLDIPEGLYAHEVEFAESIMRQLETPATLPGGREHLTDKQRAWANEILERLDR